MLSVVDPHRGGPAPPRAGLVSAAQLVADAVDSCAAMASCASVELRSLVTQEMPPVLADRDRLLQFDRFWQARRTAGTSAGLGLPIVRGIVEAHRGSAWVESGPGRGSTFSFTIPAATRIERTPDDSSVRPRIGDEEHGSGSVPDRRPDSPPSRPRPRVLLADDQEEILTAFERLLTPSCEVVGRVTQVDALVDAATRLRPDVIVIDLFTPQRHGVEACRRLKEVVPQAKIIVVSGIDDAMTRQKALLAGAAALIAKVRAAEELLPSIHEVGIERPGRPRDTPFFPHIRDCDGSPCPAPTS